MITDNRNQNLIIFNIYPKGNLESRGGIFRLAELEVLKRGEAQHKEGTCFSKIGGGGGESLGRSVKVNDPMFMFLKTPVNFGTF